VPLCTGWEMLQVLAPPLFAVCGQNIRKVKRKVYGPNDLVSTESQTDDTDDKFFQLGVVQPTQTLVFDKDKDRKLRNMFRKLK
jgi:hypothetical protein